MPNISILSFCWQAFDPRVASQFRIGELADRARQYTPYPFIIYDSYWHKSALVLPETVERVVSELQLSDSATVVGSGLFDFLRGDQIMVSAQTPARLVVRLASWRAASAVLAVDDKGFPHGLFVPESVGARLAELMQAKQGRLSGGRFTEFSSRLAKGFTTGSDALGRFSALVEAIDAIDNEMDEFHSENLNSRNPEIGVCADDGYAHLTPLPCSVHGQSNIVGALEVR